MIPMSRRRFLSLTSATVVAGCAGSANSGAPTTPTTLTTTADAVVTTTTVPGGAVTTATLPAGLIPGDHVLVIVELNGGNDAVNTLIPDLGSYRDVRPTLALAEQDILRVGSLPGHGLHPALAPIVPLIDDGRVATIAAVGFDKPDRSHFTSTDRWHRADRMDDTLGWLGRWFDSLDQDLPALSATAFGHAGPALRGAENRPSAITSSASFAFPADISNADIRALASSPIDDPLLAAAQTAFVETVGAIEEFDPIADAVRARAAQSGDGYRDFDALAGPFRTGLAVASELIRSEVGTSVVSVFGNGFDTHFQQAGQHAALLDDLAMGLAEFWATLDESGDADRVLLLTTSEFGRRVAENGSAGSDHGSAGVSFLMGDAVDGRLFGTIDTDNPVDGDLEPQIDPRTIFTDCLDWLGGDVEVILGDRHDDQSFFG